MIKIREEEWHLPSGLHNKNRSVKYGKYQCSRHRTRETGASCPYEARNTPGEPVAAGAHLWAGPLAVELRGEPRGSGRCPELGRHSWEWGAEAAGITERSSLSLGAQVVFPTCSRTACTGPPVGRWALPQGSPYQLSRVTREKELASRSRGQGHLRLVHFCSPPPTPVAPLLKAAGCAAPRVPGHVSARVGSGGTPALPGTCSEGRPGQGRGEPQ